MLLLDCLSSAWRDSVNPWTANWAVEKGTRALRLAAPENPATDDSATMWPLPKRCIPGSTDSRSLINLFIYNYLDC